MKPTRIPHAIAIFSRHLSHYLLPNHLLATCLLLTESASACELSSYLSHDTCAGAGLSATQYLNGEEALVRSLMTGTWLRGPNATGHAEILTFDRKGDFVHTRYNSMIDGDNHLSIGHTEFGLNDHDIIVPRLVPSDYALTDEEEEISSTSPRDNLFGTTITQLDADTLIILVPPISFGAAEADQRYHRLPNIKGDTQGTWVRSKRSTTARPSKTCSINKDGKTDFGFGTHCTFFYILDKNLVIADLISRVAQPGNGISVMPIQRSGEHITLSTDIADGDDNQADALLPQIKLATLDKPGRRPGSDRKRRLLIEGQARHEGIVLPRLLSHAEYTGPFNRERASKSASATLYRPLLERAQ